MQDLEVVFMEESEERIEFVMNKLNEGLTTKVENWGLTQAEKRGIMNRITNQHCQKILNWMRFCGLNVVVIPKKEKEVHNYEKTSSRSLKRC